MIEFKTNQWIRPNSNFYKKIVKKAEFQNQITIDLAARKHFFKRLKQKVSRLKFSASKQDPWKNYYSEIPEGVNKENKIKTIHKILKEKCPNSVLDLGCNDGVFAILAAESGAQVIAIDSSEACIESLYSVAKKKKLSIVPLIADVVCPTPAFGYMSVQYLSLYDRVQSDMVFCLGLMHHLHLTGRQPFQNIAKLLNKVTKKWLIFEYIDTTDDNVVFFKTNRKIDYNLDSVTSSLRPYFKDIIKMDSDRPGRSIFLCSK